MTRSNTWTILILILIFGDLLAFSVVNQYMEQEVEHEVQYEDAISKARKLKLYPGPVLGCKSCTSEEITYCRSGQVLEDHCCCDNDSKNNEVFPFVEHTCHLRPEVCKVHASNCAEYSRLRDCCCHAFLASQWKYLAGSSGKPNPTVLQIIAIAVLLRLFL